jgi:transcriptional regulator with XRE-family HTH domain
MRAARELAGLSLAAVARATGVSVNSVVQWEHGAVPGEHLRPLLAAMYDLDEDVLFAELAARTAANQALIRRPA